MANGIKAATKLARIMALDPFVHHETYYKFPPTFDQLHSAAISPSDWVSTASRARCNTSIPAPAR